MNEKDAYVNMLTPMVDLEWSLVEDDLIAPTSMDVRCKPGLDACIIHTMCNHN